MRTLSGGYSRTFLAALMVFFISMATVMGPTPPGTGVMKPAFCLTPGHRQRNVVTSQAQLQVCAKFKQYF